MTGVPVTVGELVGLDYINGVVRPIYDTTLAAPAASVDFSGIVASYAHLRVVYECRSDGASSPYGLQMRVNGDSGSHYGFQDIRGSGTTPTVSTASAGSFATVGAMPGASASAAAAAHGELLIPNYAANGIFTKGWIGYSGFYETTPWVQLVTGAWTSSAAINELTFSPAAGNFVAGSRFTVYAMGA